MSDKLDQIKDWFRRGLIDDEDIEWLISQAEKIREIKRYIASIYIPPRDDKKVEFADKLLSIISDNSCNKEE